MLAFINYEKKNRVTQLRNKELKYRIELLDGYVGLLEDKYRFLSLHSKG